MDIRPAFYKGTIRHNIFCRATFNILRAFTLVLNPEQDVLTIHTLQGVVFFLIGFSLLYAVDNVLMRYLAKDSGVHKGVSPGAGSSKGSSPV